MLLTIILSVLLIILLRIIYLIQFKQGRNKKLQNRGKTLIVIGSGGHTLEMLKLVKTINPNLYSPRLYVMANTDKSSEHKINEIEKEFFQVSKTDFDIVKIPRSRELNQSYYTSIFTTIYSTLKSVPVVFSFKPDLILSNGPGTCIPVCIIGFILNAFLFFETKIVFIESFCRVKSLSLSGKILLYLADVVIVQWPELHKKYPRTIFLGKPYTNQ